MSDTLKIKYKIGAIEFEAEGSAEAVEQQRVNFMNAVLPAAVDAMVRTQAVVERQSHIEPLAQPALLEADVSDAPMITPHQPENEFSRTSLASFLKKYGQLTEEDFILFSAYFDEQKTGKRTFSIDDVKGYYADARRPVPTNPSMSLHRLAKKGHIMDASKSEDAKGRKHYYTLTDDGITYIKSYVQKGDSAEKKKSRAKAKKSAPKISEAYASITADDLNIKNYPAVKALSGPKEQVIMAMYIVTNEGKGEWFTVEDVIHLLVNIFEVHADKDKVNGVFKRNMSMFASEQDTQNKKALRRKLLSGAKDLASSIIRDAKQ